MWNNSSPPPNWGICDGTQYNTIYGPITSPDLRNRFILSSGPGYTGGSSGGSSTILVSNLPSHNHYIYNNDQGHTHGIPPVVHTHPVNDPKHSHQIDYGGNNRDDNSMYNDSSSPGNNPVFVALTNYNDAGLSANSNFTGLTTTQGALTNIMASSVDTGGNSPYYPPYFTLLYIMRFM
jgi:hypothetical protein